MGFSKFASHERSRKISVWPENSNLWLVCTIDLQEARIDKLAQCLKENEKRKNAVRSTIVSRWAVKKDKKNESKTYSILYTNNTNSFKF